MFTISKHYPVFSMGKWTSLSNQVIDLDTLLWQFSNRDRDLGVCKCRTFCLNQTRTQSRCE